MYQVFFNRKEICRLTIDELQALKAVSVFWGMDWNDTSNRLSGRLSDKSFRIVGLNHKESNRLNQLLSHTNASLSPSPHSNTLVLSIFRDTDPKMFIRVESDNGVYDYTNQSGDFPTTMDWVYKRFNPDQSAKEMKIFWNPEQCEEISEWIAYLILCCSHKESPDVLDVIPREKYESLLRKVLTPINPVLSSYQLRTSWPELPLITKTEDERKAEPIDPFKYNHDSTPTKFNPFKNKPNKSETKVINPFFKK